MRLACRLTITVGISAFGVVLYDMVVCVSFFFFLPIR